MSDRLYEMEQQTLIAEMTLRNADLAHENERLRWRVGDWRGYTLIAVVVGIFGISTSLAVVRDVSDDTKVEHWCQERVDNIGSCIAHEAETFGNEWKCVALTSEREPTR